jgi:hypothetical protein
VEADEECTSLLVPDPINCAITHDEFNGGIDLLLSEPCRHRPERRGSQGARVERFDGCFVPGSVQARDAEVTARCIGPFPGDLLFSEPGPFAHLQVLPTMCLKHPEAETSLNE